MFRLRITTVSEGFPDKLRAQQLDFIMNGVRAIFQRMINSSKYLSKYPQYRHEIDLEFKSDPRILRIPTDGKFVSVPRSILIKFDTKFTEIKATGRFIPTLNQCRIVVGCVGSSFTSKTLHKPEFTEIPKGQIPKYIFTYLDEDKQGVPLDKNRNRFDPHGFLSSLERWVESVFWEFFLDRMHQFLIIQKEVMETTDLKEKEKQEWDKKNNKERELILEKQRIRDQLEKERFDRQEFKKNQRDLKRKEM